MPHSIFDATYPYCCNALAFEVFPRASQLAKAFETLMANYNWRRFGLISSFNGNSEISTSGHRSFKYAGVELRSYFFVNILFLHLLFYGIFTSFLVARAIEKLTGVENVVQQVVYVLQRDLLVSFSCGLLGHVTDMLHFARRLPCFF